jgi:WD40 repeat protein
VESIAFSPDGMMLATGGWDGSLCVWETLTGKEIWRPPGDAGWVTCLTFSPDGKTLASGSSDGIVRLYCLTSRKEIRCFRGHLQAINTLAFSVDGAILASAGGITRESATGKATKPDYTIRFWDLVSGKEKQRCLGHRDEVLAIRFLRAANRLVSVSSDGTCRVWDTTSGKEVKRVSMTKPLPSRASLSSDGEIVALTRYPSPTEIVETMTGKRVCLLPGDQYSVALCIASDGSLIASWGDGKLRLWNKKGKECQQIATSADRVNCLTLSPDGKLVAAGSGDQTVRIWRVDSGKEVAPLQGHSGIIRGIAFSLQGPHLLSGCGDGTIHCWDALV